MDGSEYAKKSTLKTIGNTNSKLTTLNQAAIERILSFMTVEDLLLMRETNRSLKRILECQNTWCSFLLSRYLPNLSFDPQTKPEDGAAASSSSFSSETRLPSLKNSSTHIWFSYFMSVVALNNSLTDSEDFGQLLNSISSALLSTLKSRPLSPDSDMPLLKLGKTYPLVRTTSSFQIFLLDVLRSESLESQPGLGGLADLNEDEVGMQVEDWVFEHESEIEDFVGKDPYQGRRG